MLIHSTDDLINAQCEDYITQLPMMAEDNI